jgi:nucleotide-binding universal stress UspA family protein
MSEQTWTACEPASEPAVSPDATAAWGAMGGIFSRILVPIDGGEAAARALEAAARLAERDGAELALLAVVDVRLTYAAEAGIPPADLLTSLRREARSFLLNGNLGLPPALHAVEMLREGEPAGEIVAAARAWEADLIVLGQAHHSGLGQLFADRTADTVAHRAPCPVLVVHQGPAAGGAAWGWKRMLRWARLKDEPGCSDRVPA